MKNTVLAALAALALNNAAAKEREICVMQFNVWQEGTSVPGGFEAMADEIARQAPDIVTLSEVRNYHDTRFCDRIVEALAKRGLTYHSFYSTDTGLLSRTEITDSAVIFPYIDDHGTVHKLVTEIDGHRVAAYTAHLDYLDDTYYEVRGYDGNSWKEIDPITDHDELMRRNLLSQRDEAARLAAADIAREREAGSLIFLGGDLNEPSGLDWTEATASTADHRGVVIKWPTIEILHDAGLVDTYRAIYPDPVEYPGYTYPRQTKSYLSTVSHGPSRPTSATASTMCSTFPTRGCHSGRSTSSARSAILSAASGWLPTGVNATLSLPSMCGRAITAP